MRKSWLVSRYCNDIPNGAGEDKMVDAVREMYPEGKTASHEAN